MCYNERAGGQAELSFRIIFNGVIIVSEPIAAGAF